MCTPADDTIPLPYQNYSDSSFDSSSFFHARSDVVLASSTSSRTQRKKVSYFFPKGVGHAHYGERHPMKPARLTLTTSLVLGYGLQKYMDVFAPRAATKDEMAAFHDSEYLDFLSNLSKPQTSAFPDQKLKFNLTDDCPPFPNLYNFCASTAGASLLAARNLTSQNSEIAINWTGGLHHAHKSEASGFCYVNDIVLGILELLRVHPRVLYIDIDIHHGDGVQEAFYNSNRVMTVSFHKFVEGFFPGTGAMQESGIGIGKHFSLNVPLKDGIDDESYVSLFKGVMEPCISTFLPTAIVLQCGADSLGCDRLGDFNLSISAHGECVRFIKSFDLPLLVLGGGGYTIRNVSRCWTYETSILCDTVLPDALPPTPYDEFFAPDYKLHPAISGKIENQNTRQSLEKIRIQIREQLRYLHGAPSIQMQAIPPDIASLLEDRETKKSSKSEDNDLEMGT